MLINKRLAPRKEIDCIARLDAIDGPTQKLVEGKVVDLSRGGISLLVADALTPGAQYIAKFEISFNGEAHSIAVPSVLIYCARIPDNLHKVGLQFKELRPESAEAISRFMEHLAQA